MDRSKKMAERTPQCRVYRSPRHFLARVIIARRTEQSSNVNDEYHVGMLLSAPTSNNVTGFRNPSAPHMYMINLAARLDTVINSTVKIRIQAIFFARATSTMTFSSFGA